MEPIQDPAPTSMAMASLALIWCEALAGRQSFWQSLRESIETMEIRHNALVKQREHEIPRGTYQGDPYWSPPPKRARGHRAPKPRRNEEVYTVYEKPQPRPAGHRGPWFE